MPTTRKHERKESPFEDGLGLTTGLERRDPPAGGYRAILAEDQDGRKRTAVYVSQPRAKGEASWLDHFAVEPPASMLKGLDVKKTAKGVRVKVTKATAERGRKLVEWARDAAAGMAPRVSAAPAAAHSEQPGAKKKRTRKS